MARNVFISFRYSDGNEYKEELARLFNASEDTVDFSRRWQCHLASFSIDVRVSRNDE